MHPMRPNENDSLCEIDSELKEEVGGSKIILNNKISKQISKKAGN